MIPKYIQGCLTLVKNSEKCDEMIRCLEEMHSVGGLGFTVGAQSVTYPVYNLKTISWPTFVNYCFHTSNSNRIEMIKYLKDGS